MQSRKRRKPAYSLLLIIGCCLLCLEIQAQEKEVDLQQQQQQQQQQAKSFLDQVSMETEVQQQSDQVVAENFYQSGKVAFSELRYEDAVQHLETAVLLDSDHKDAVELLAKTRWLMGAREDSFRVAVDLLEEEKKVELQAKLVEIDHLFKQGVRSFESGEYKQALKYFNSVEERIRWMPYHVDLTRQLSATQTYIARTEVEMQNAEEEDKRLRLEDALSRAKNEAERDKIQEARRIQMLLDEADRYVNETLYDKAVQLANKVLDMDPSNSRAKGIKRKSQVDRWNSRHDWIDENIKIEMERALDNVNWAMIPYSQLVVYPKNWDEIKEKRQAMSLTQAKSDEPWVQRIRLQMQHPVTFDFEDTPLEQVISFLQSLTDINIVLDPNATTVAGESLDRPVRLKVSDMPFESALTWLLRLTDLEYTFRDEAIFISTAEGIQDASELRIYDVRDLTGVIRDYPGPSVQLVAGDESGDLFGDLGGEPDDPMTADSIVELITGLVDSDSWGATNTIDFRNGNLLVIQTPQNHGKIAILLEDLRKFQALQVSIQAKFLRLRANFMQAIGVDWGGLGVDADQNTQLVGQVAGLQNTQLDPVQSELLEIDNDFNADQDAFSEYTAGFLSESGKKDYIKARNENYIDSTINQTVRGVDFGRGIFDPDTDGGLTLQYAFIKKYQLQAILNAVEKDRESNIIHSPRITCFNRQRAHLMVADEMAYVQDVDVTTGTYSVAVDPVIGTFQSGSIMDVRPTVSSDRRYVTLDLYPSQILFPEALGTMNLEVGLSAGGGSLPVRTTIEFPRLYLTKVRTTVMVPDGGTALIGGLMQSQDVTAVSGIPFLSKIPVLNWFFSDHEKGQHRENEMILVTPKILIMSEYEDAI